jgi:hypothetical protein
MPISDVIFRRDAVRLTFPSFNDTANQMVLQPRMAGLRRKTLLFGLTRSGIVVAMIPAGQATPACTDLIDLSRLRVNYSRGNFRGTEFRFGTLQESLVPVLRIQVDLKCTGNFIFTSLVDGGRPCRIIFDPPAGV